MNIKVEYYIFTKKWQDLLNYIDTLVNETQEYKDLIKLYAYSESDLDISDEDLNNLINTVLNYDWSVYNITELKNKLYLIPKLFINKKRAFYSDDNLLNNWLNKSSGLLAEDQIKDINLSKIISQISDYETLADVQLDDLITLLKNTLTSYNDDLTNEKLSQSLFTITESYILFLQEKRRRILNNDLKADVSDINNEIDDALNKLSIISGV